jgi:ABC-type uncharacterized transport system involved in gliding motility auxiliary subunit
MLAASLVMVNLLGSYIGGRLDLTPGNAYTLSPATGRLVRDLDDLVTVKLFASQELPAEVALMKRDVDDLLRDLRSAGRGQVRIVERDPSDDEAARREAESLGIQPVQFKAISASPCSTVARPRRSPSSSGPTISSTGWPRPSGS